ncbi:PREDICTED: uncharacterized protein LOC109582867 [Amphimedon queenslandica]|uniref:Uncharacterized protein n=1 Tax=Amphimedon queenslandica TaxID=400682 RepID=A0AAN0J8W4_AMPQE|nr:PREDICTED: uncharacterized protein LOC109582867 [Amphimedon queenslandica]|eukprot:XP_019853454.1 PREDICTED: uncharacterized protein LOC109582867 [Amphimedon queenslandica]
MDTGIPVNSMYAYATAEPPYDQPGFDKQFEATKEVPSTEGASDHDDMQKEEDLESDEKIQEPPPIQKGPLFSLTQEKAVIFTQPLVKVMNKNQDHYFGLSSVLNTFCCFCFCCCGMFILPCTILAMIFSIMAKKMDDSGSLKKAKAFGRISLALNIVAIISAIVFFFLWIIIFPASIAASSSSSSYYSYNYYRYSTPSYYQYYYYGK